MTGIQVQVVKKKKIKRKIGRKEKGFNWPYVLIAKKNKMGLTSGTAGSRH